MLVRLGCIVEGHGEVDALPVLIRRVVNVFDPSITLSLETRRVPKSQMVRAGEVERAIEAITRRLGRSASILVLLDADKNCPPILAQSILERCQKAHADVVISVVVAKCEYEAWFLAAAASLAGKNGLLEDLTSPNDPESKLGAKQWLSSRMAPQSPYVETRHQKEFSRLMDLSQARSSRSFRKFEKEIFKLVHEGRATV